MPQLGRVKLKDLIKYLRKLGYDGPYGGGRHVILRKGTQRIAIPNPHKGDQTISKSLLKEILRQAGIDIATWEAL
ncbi:MAG TPA: type II toxin-antitoxin system HicA family toxin [Pyrinomonadaceae bacterium]